MVSTGLRTALRSAGLALFVAMTPCFILARPTEAYGQIPSRQVVAFGVLAKPGGTTTDRRISAPVAAQLRRTLPGHSFQLIEIRSSHVMTGQSVNLSLGGGFTATTQLLN